MDFTWLTNIFSGVLKIFSPLKLIAHWRIWSELKGWYERFKKWRDWYKQHILAPMRQMQQLQREIYNQFMRPILTLVDHIRQLTGIVGIFNKKLANKLNFYFFRIESYLLAPLNKITSRTNTLGFAIQGILTPLGYLDRGTLLNSTWRDAGLIKQILHNPFDQHPAAATLAPDETVDSVAGKATAYLSTGSGEYQADVDAAVLNYQNLRAQG